jgi:hypothetical protein
MPWPRRAKDTMATVLRLGRLPLDSEDGLRFALDEEPDLDDTTVL